ncbi:MAG: oligosaccharide flippase family protein, partial [Muribaculaceae bacterium]|nr:oligosaccharide flippase family protein [Muribaculaceae bacterium]
MAGAVKSLAKDTVIYGLSSIVGRFLNWLLVPLYTQMLATGEYGIVTNVYSYVALVLVILTYGMETGFFRFINHEKCKDPMEVYSTTMISIASTSLAFIALIFCF